MLSLLGSDEGVFLLLQIFLHQFPPQVERAALVNFLCLAVGDFHGLAKEADCVLLTSGHFSIYGVASADNEDPVMGLEFLPIGNGATCAFSFAVARLGATSLHAL